MMVTHDAIFGFIAATTIMVALFFGYALGVKKVLAPKDDYTGEQYQGHVPPAPRESVTLEEQILVQEVQQVFKKQAEGWDNIMSFDPVKAMQEMKRKVGDTA